MKINLYLNYLKGPQNIFFLKKDCKLKKCVVYVLFAYQNVQNKKGNNFVEGFQIAKHLDNLVLTELAKF